MVAVGICSPAAFELSSERQGCGSVVSVYVGYLESAVRLCEWQRQKAKFIACHRCCAEAPSTLPRPWEADLRGAHYLGPQAFWLPDGKPPPDTGGWRRETGTLGPSACPTPSQLPLAAPPPWGSRRALPHSPLALAGRGRSPASTSPAGPLGAAHPAPCVQVSPEQAQQSVPSPAVTLGDADLARLPLNRDGRAQRTRLANGGS